jgi:hypothetical protein
MEHKLKKFPYVGLTDHILGMANVFVLLFTFISRRGPRSQNKAEVPKLGDETETFLYVTLFVYDV